MDIVVKGRNVEVPEHYRVHVSEKLSRLERYDRKIVRFDVELFLAQSPAAQELPTGRDHHPDPRPGALCRRLRRRLLRRP